MMSSDMRGEMRLSFVFLSNEDISPLILNISQRASLKLSTLTLCPLGVSIVPLDEEENPMK